MSYLKKQNIHSDNKNIEEQLLNLCQNNKEDCLNILNNTINKKIDDHIGKKYKSTFDELNQVIKKLEVNVDNLDNDNVNELNDAIKNINKGMSGNLDDLPEKINDLPEKLDEPIIGRQRSSAVS